MVGAELQAVVEAKHTIALAHAVEGAAALAAPSTVEASEMIQHHRRGRDSPSACRGWPHRRGRDRRRHRHTGGSRSYQAGCVGRGASRRRPGKLSDLFNVIMTTAVVFRPCGRDNARAVPSVRSPVVRGLPILHLSASHLGLLLGVCPGSAEHPGPVWRCLPVDRHQCRVFGFFLALVFARLPFYFLAVALIGACAGTAIGVGLLQAIG